MKNQHTPGQSIYADPKAPHQELTDAQRAILGAVPVLDAAPVRRHAATKWTPSPWGTSPQPGGGWIAVRVNGNSPGGGDRLPAEGQFRTEAEARAAIAKDAGDTQ